MLLNAVSSKVKTSIEFHSALVTRITLFIMIAVLSTGTALAATTHYIAAKARPTEPVDEQYPPHRATYSSTATLQTVAPGILPTSSGGFSYPQALHPSGAPVSVSSPAIPASR